MLCERHMSNVDMCQLGLQTGGFPVGFPLNQPEGAEPPEKRAQDAPCLAASIPPQLPMFQGECLGKMSQGTLSIVPFQGLGN